MRICFVLIRAKPKEKIIADGHRMEWIARSVARTMSDSLIPKMKGLIKLSAPPNKIK